MRSILGAIRAAAAAATYFKPFETYSDAKRLTGMWIDAGLKFNNPALHVLREVGNKWGDSNQVINLRAIDIFMTLGTGLPPVTSIEPGSTLQQGLDRLGLPTNVMRALREICTDTESTHKELAWRFREHPAHDVYQRFNAVQGVGDFDLAKWDAARFIEELTVAYLQSEPTATWLNGTIAYLAESYEQSRSVPDLNTEEQLQRRFEELRR